MCQKELPPMHCFFDSLAEAHSTLHHDTMKLRDKQVLSSCSVLPFISLYTNHEFIGKLIVVLYCFDGMVFLDTAIEVRAQKLRRISDAIAHGATCFA